MYKVLLVDDEAVERKVLSFLLQQYRFPFEVREANNGEEAIKLLEKNTFHLLITDVKMPIIDGIELARRAKILNPQMHIIFFSGYDDFACIKQALSLQAVNYMLKPIDREEFRETISRVLEVIQTEQAAVEQQREAQRIRRRSILVQVLNGMQPERLALFYPEKDLLFLNQYHHLFLVQVKSEKDFEGNEALQQILPEDCDWVDLEVGQSLLMFYGKTHRVSWYQEQAEWLMKAIQRRLNVDCRIEISGAFDGCNALYKEYMALTQTMKERLFFADSSVDGRESGNAGDVNLYNEEILLKDIQKAIQVKDITSLRKHISFLLETYKSQRYSRLYVHFVCTKVIKLFLDWLPGGNDGQFEAYARKIYEMKYLSQIEVLLLELTDQVADELENSRDSCRTEIRKVKQYINAHYGEVLDLGILSEYVNLTPHYLSTLFIREEGVGLNKYINDVRMQRAQELLLNTNLTVGEICTRVGFSNLSYFCKKFQKNYGMTPEQFQQNSGMKLS